MKKLFVLIILLSGTYLYSQESIYFELVKDINKYYPPDDTEVHSNPYDLISLGDVFVFVATGDTVDRELYVSDGTSEGTQLLKNINTSYYYPFGSDPEDLVRLGDKIIFSAEDNYHGRELWITDGTTDGTQLVKDIREGELGSYPDYLTVYNGKVYFRAYEVEYGEMCLYTTDGTPENTYKLVDSSGNDVVRPWYFYEYNDILYFRAEESSSEDELWRTDGTPEGTYILKNINETEGSFPNEFYEYNGLLYFRATGDSEMSHEL